MAREKGEAGEKNFGAELDSVLNSVGDSESVGYLDIQRKTGLGGPLLDDVLERLERLGLIKSRNVQGVTHYWKPMQTQAQIWFTVDEAAKYLRVSKRTIYKLVKESQLAPYKVGRAGHRRFRQEDIDAVMRREPGNIETKQRESALTAPADPVLAELWDNDNDAEYDRL